MRTVFNNMTQQIGLVVADESKKKDPCELIEPGRKNREHTVGCVCYDLKHRHNNGRLKTSSQALNARRGDRQAKLIIRYRDGLRHHLLVDKSVQQHHNR